MRERVTDLGAMVSARLSAIAAHNKPDVLYDPVRYVLAGQGKRLRPVLLLLCAEMYGVKSEDALPIALAIEVSHNWALVHDDIMDGATTRRGRATVHVKWDADTALLCGDVLMGLAFGQLLQAKATQLPALLGAFARTVTALCEGQALDMQFETRADVTTAEYLHMIDLKTGALIGAALEMGAILGDGSPEDRAAVCSAGMALGRAFQLQDDLLDLVAKDGRWGKVIGGDIIEGKKTFLLLESLNRAQGGDRVFFDRIQHCEGIEACDIAEARSRMDRLGVLACARNNVAHYTSLAIGHLSALPRRADVLVAIMKTMAAREH